MRILAVGAHIGDTELMAGPYLCQSALDGASCFMLALTSGEKGNPEVEPAKYKVQKLREAKEFSDKSGIPYEIFEDVPDAYLMISDQIIRRIKKIIEENEITHVVTHWRGSFHPDHRQAYDIVSHAVLQLNLLRKESQKIVLKFSENWEDMNGFIFDEYASISETASAKWANSVKHESFIYGTFSKFRYFDYYQALMRVRGCLSQHEYAIALMHENQL